MMHFTVMAAVYAVLILLLELFHRAERKDMYNRLMCRDASEYKKLHENKKSAAKPPYVVTAQRGRDREAGGKG